MRLPVAIGYLRRDVSGVRQPWDEHEMRSCAGTLGYNYAKTVVFSERTRDPERRLCAVVGAWGVALLVVPSLDHFDGGALPRALRAIVEVRRVDEPRKQRWSRRFR